VPVVNLIMLKKNGTGGIYFTEEVVNQHTDTFPYQTIRVCLGDSFVDGIVILKNNLENYHMKVW
jgi:hypothetical protein